MPDSGQALMLDLGGKYNDALRLHESPQAFGKRKSK
jgi:hypothetical protein